MIPFFQRQSGILRRALQSVADQDFSDAIRVLLVNDGSPVPARDELDAVRMPRHVSVELIERPNGGPGAARNTGLASVRSDTRYVAFLDSDDTWARDHLARAAEALGRGHDFFFANHFQLGQSIGAFERAGRIVASNHRRIETVSEDLYAFTGDLIDQVLFENPVGTSTVVFDHKRFGAARFDPRFTSMGEDYLFWMTLGSMGAKPAFSTRIAATYGKGVNVFAGTGWGSEGHLLLVHQEIAFKREAARRFVLTGAQRKRLEVDIDKARLMFARVVLHRLARRKDLQGSIIMEQLRRDPLSLLTMPRDIARAALLRAR